MSISKWTPHRSKSAFDISTSAIDDFVPPGLVPDKRDEYLLSNEQEFPNAARRASEIPLGKPPMPQNQGVRRQSLIDKAFNGTLKNDIKKMWARRSSLTLFKTRSQRSPRASDEESLNSSQESIDDLMKEMGGFFMVDRSHWAPPPPQPAAPAPKRRSFSLFSRKI